MARVSDAFPALVSVTVCSACGKVPELCGCDSLRFCGVCWLLIDHCYCDAITIFLDAEDVEFIDPAQPPPLPPAPGQELVPCLLRLDEEYL